MRKKLLLLLLLVPLLTLGQQEDGFPFKAGKIVYGTVLQVPGLQKGVLAERAAAWLTATFLKDSVRTVRQAGDILVLENADCMLALPSSNVLYQSFGLEMQFDVKINCKDQRCEVAFFHISTKSAALGAVNSDVAVPLEIFAREMYKTRFKPRQAETNTKIKAAVEEKFRQLQEALRRKLDDLNLSAEHADDKP